MFPLAGKTFPTSPQELADGIREALAEVIALPKVGDPVRVEGGQWPKLKHVTVDLSGASIDPTQPALAPPKPEGKREPGVSVDQLDIIGKPINVAESKLNVTLEAHDVSFDFAHDEKGQAMLVLTDAKDGHVQVRIGKADLQALLLAAASVAAKAQGVTIQDLQLDLTSDGPRAVSAEARVKARTMVMSGTVIVRGKAQVDDGLVATLSDLACTGEGMIGGMAAAMVNPKLKSFEGKRVPLMTFSLGDTTLRDVEISTGQTIEVTADFGRK